MLLGIAKRDCIHETLELFVWDSEVNERFQLGEVFKNLWPEIVWLFGRPMVTSCERHPIWAGTVPVSVVDYP